MGIHIIDTLDFDRAWGKYETATMLTGPGLGIDIKFEYILTRRALVQDGPGQHPGTGLLVHRNTPPKMVMPAAKSISSSSSDHKCTRFSFGGSDILELGSRKELSTLLKLKL